MKKLIFLLALVAISHCNVFSQGCLPEGITFTTQEQIDNFQTNYPGCTEIEGDVLIGSWGGISNTNIINLNGLNTITKIESRLEIIGCDAIGDLSGLSSLTQVDDYFIIFDCSELDNLSGLNSLIHVGGGFVVALNNFLTNIQALESLNSIGAGLWIEFNLSLQSLDGLDNLVSVDSSIYIDHNDNLSDISSLKNFNPNLLYEYFVIKFNESLSECATESICNYLENPNGLIAISNNAPGCNSPEEVLLACESAIDDNNTEELALFPNPASSYITLTAPAGQPIEEAIIYNYLGQKALEAVPVNNTVDVSKLEPGIYFLEVITSENRAGTKLVVE